MLNELSVAANMAWVEGWRESKETFRLMVFLQGGKEWSRKKLIFSSAGF